MLSMNISVADVVPLCITSRRRNARVRLEVLVCRSSFVHYERFKLLLKCCFC